MTENLYTPDCLRTHTGQYVNLLEPAQETIFPFDIAIGLARLCRFGGHTKRVYSVAEHSVWCALRAEELYPQSHGLHFIALMHDAHEYLTGDIPTPFKRLLPNFEDIAQKVQNAIHYRYGVSITHDQEQLMRDIDKEALEWEWKNKVLTWKELPLDDKAAADYFIHHFVRLCKHPFVLQ